MSEDVLERPWSHGDRLTSAPKIDVVIPVFNEERALVHCVEQVRAHLATLPFTARVTIADNASTDGTALLARQLSHRYPDVALVTLAEKGRGRALKKAWAASDAEILVYMDVDLSTDLNGLLPLVAPLLSGHSDLAIGSRLARSSRTTRGPRREVISRAYNYLLRGTLRTRFSDAQCGFKAMRRDVARHLLPLVEDDAWFFDTELLVVAERAGLRIHEVPVDWVDDPDSTVDVVRTALEDLRGMARLGTALLRGRVPLAEVAEALGRASEQGSRGRLGSQVLVFGLIGVVSTVVHGALYLGGRDVLGPQWANAVALLLATVANTAANRRFTFGVRGTAAVARHHGQALLVLGAGLAASGLGLWLVRDVAGPDHPALEMTVLVAANLCTTLVRFVLMRRWIFTRRR